MFCSQVLQELLHKWVTEELLKENTAITPTDMKARLVELKPPRLAAYEMQNKRSGDTIEEGSKKKHKDEDTRDPVTPVPGQSAGVDLSMWE